MTENNRMMGKLFVLALAMFGFGWAMIPIYNAICEVTQLNTLTQTDRGAEQFARNTQVDSSRKVVVEFDTNSRGPWRFKPEVNALEVHPGQLMTVLFDVVNNEDRVVAGQAIPSYAPGLAAEYFRKIECFCFRQQTLQPNEAKQFPVVFVVDPKLPKGVNTITLSYTFFEVAGPVGSVGSGQATANAATVRGG